MRRYEFYHDYELLEIKKPLERGLFLSLAKAVRTAPHLTLPYLHYLAVPSRTLPYLTCIT